MMMLSSFLLLVCAIVLISWLWLLFSWCTEYFDYFKNQGIPGPKPIPFFGTYWKFWKNNLFKVELEHYNQYGRIYGTFDGRTPNLVIAKPDLIKRILVKDFACFTNRRKLVVSNPYLCRSLNALRDHNWESARNVMNPAFSIGKIKRMHNIMNDCAKLLVENMKPFAHTTQKVNLKSLIGVYTMDVITACVFGTKIESLKEPDNPFIANAKKIFSTSGAGNWIITLIYLYPCLSKYFLPSSIFHDVNIFAQLSQEIISQRRANFTKAQRRNDFLDLLLEAAELDENSNPLKNDTTLVAQVLIFLLAGYDTTAMTICLTIHLLALSPEMQCKVRTEILEQIKLCGCVDSELLAHLPYMEKCIWETLRLYPPITKIERFCNKTVEYDNFHIKKGTIVTIPIFSIHRDPEFYTDPLTYNPERFSPTEKSKRDPILYLPFGHGKRHCIGQNLGIEKIKLAICHLLSNFDFFPIPETKDPPEFTKSCFGLLQNSNIWIGVKNLSNNN